MPSSIGRALAISPVLTLICIAVLLADERGPAAAPADPVVTRSYSVRELLDESTNFPITPAPPNQASWAGYGGPRDPKAERAEHMSAIISLIQATIAPQTWKENGGSVGSATSMDPFIVIRHTEPVQKQIDDLLDQVRTARAAQLAIEIDAQWILASTEQAAQWQNGKPFVPDALNDPRTLYSRGRATALDGQLVHITSGQISREAFGATPIVGNDVAAYQPGMASVHVGTSLELVPWVSDDLSSVLVDVSATAREDLPGPPTPAPTTRAGDPVDLINALEKRPRRDQHIAETVRLFPGVPKFVGGMTLEPGKPQSGHLCLMLTARLPKPAVGRAGGPIASFAAENGTAVEMRVFSLRDFMAHSHFEPAPSDDDYGPTPEIPPAKWGTSSQEEMNSIVKLIQENVEPETWKDLGGSVGTINQWRTVIVSTQTAATHKQMRELLDRFRHDWAIGLTIEVDAQWIAASAEQMASWQAGQAIGAEALGDPKTLYACARVCAAEGRRASVASGLLSSQASGAEPVVGNDVCSWQVNMSPARLGISLDVTPRLSDDRRAVLADVTSLVSESLPAPAPARPPSARPSDVVNIINALEKPAHKEQHLAQTVRLIPGEPKFVGGMTLDPGKGEDRHLCLILTARVVDASAGKPEAPTTQK